MKMTMPIMFMSLSALAITAPMVHAHDEVVVVNIANAPKVKEKPYASVRGWNVVTGTVKGRIAYCTAIKVSDKSQLRLGSDGGQWQLGVPYAHKRGEYTGTMDLDGKASGTYGTSDGKWTFLWLNLGERDAMMQAKSITIDIGKASFDYGLDGAYAASLKVTECVEKHIK